MFQAENITPPLVKDACTEEFASWTASPAVKDSLFTESGTHSGEFSYQELLGQLKNEAPVYPKTELTIVIPVYKELLNGNLANMLSGASAVGIPKDRVAWIFVVNNALPKKTSSDDYLHFLESNSLENEWLGFLENQLTLQILKMIESAFQESAPNRAKILAQMRQVWSRAGIKVPLYRGFELALMRKVQLAALDCSSFGRAFKQPDIGMARRIGAQLSDEYVTPNTKLISFSDADTLRSEEHTRNLLKIANHDQSPAYALSQKLVPHMPAVDERFITQQSMLSVFSTYFAMACLSFERYLGNLDIDALGGSQLSVRPEVLREIPYPSGADFEDFHFADAVRKKFPIISLDDPNLQLFLKLRFRPESFDGQGFPIMVSGLEDQLQKIKRREVDLAKKWLTNHFAILTQHFSLSPRLFSWVGSRKLECYLSILEEYRVKYQQDAKKTDRFVQKFASSLIKHLAENDAQQVVVDPVFSRFEQDWMYQNETFINYLINEGLSRHWQKEDQVWDYLQQYFAYQVKDLENDVALNLDEILLTLQQENCFPAHISVTDLLYIPAAQHAFQVKHQSKLSALDQHARKTIRNLFLPLRERISA